MNIRHIGMFGAAARILRMGVRHCEAHRKPGRRARAQGICPRRAHPWAPTLANMSHMGKNTPSASTSTMPPTATIKTGSITALKLRNW